MKGRKTMRMNRIAPAALALALLASGCLQPDPSGDPDATGASGIPDKEPLAGATSSTNWPQEEAGSAPIEIFGTADTALVFSFKQTSGSAEEALPIRATGTARLYPAGIIPVFDALPSKDLAFADADSITIAPDDFNSLFAKGMDTIGFTVEFRMDTARALMPGFVYSRKEGKFLRWPPGINATDPTACISPHYKFAGIPDSLFAKALSDTTGNARFYYYIPGSPYFWRHSLVKDSLYIGPTVNGRLPLRCVKVTSHAGPKADFEVEVFPLSLVKEFVYDDTHTLVPVSHFRLGELLFQASGQGSPPVRDP